MLIDLKDHNLKYSFAKPKPITPFGFLKNKILTDKTPYENISSIRQIFELNLSRDENIKKNQSKGDLVIPLIFCLVIIWTITFYLFQIIS